MQSKEVTKSKDLTIKIRCEITYPELTGLKPYLAVKKATLGGLSKPENSLIQLIMRDHWIQLKGQLVRRRMLLLESFLDEDSLFIYLPKEILDLISFDLIDIYTQVAEQCYLQQCNPDINPSTQKILHESGIFKPQAESDVHYGQAFFKKSAFLSTNEQKTRAIADSEQKTFGNK